MTIFSSLFLIFLKALNIESFFVNKKSLVSFNAQLFFLLSEDLLVI